MFSENANGHGEVDYEEEENDEIEATPSGIEMNSYSAVWKLVLNEEDLNKWTSLRSLVTAYDIFTLSTTYEATYP